ncbi:MAG: hypothetical protein ACPL88_04570, partial [Bryobacteraceae bacterium]
LDKDGQQRPERAVSILRAISSALDFFERHQCWRSLPVRAALGVLSDYAGEHRHVAEEILNLLARRHVPFRVLDKRAPARLRLQGLKALIYPDPDPPPQALKRRLLAFVHEGGLLIAGPEWRAPTGTSGSEDVHRRFQVFFTGKGRIAIAREPFTDPYLAALDAHLLLGRRHDPIRLWNGGSLNAHYLADADGKGAVVQLVNYSTRRAAHPVTLGVSAGFRRALFWQLGADRPSPLEILPAPQGIEVPLPEFEVYGAIELEA